MLRIAVLIWVWLFIFQTSITEAKTVNVRGYYRKDGTYVSPHTRSSPGSGGGSSISIATPSYEPRTEYRDTARSSARTTARKSSSGVENPLDIEKVDSAPTVKVTQPTVNVHISVAPHHPQMPKYPFRHWKDASGQFEVYARLVSITGTHVKLMREDGTTIEVEIEKLSEEDVQYLKSLLH
jgi:hypothetical protein